MSRDSYDQQGRRTDAEIRTTSEPKVHEPRWPVLAEEAFHGLPGDFVRTIEPHTEADTVVLLVNLMAAFGNAIGRGAWFRVGADKHHLKINAGLVGETSKARKT